MRGIIRTLAVFFYSLGGVGLLLLGVLDSSFLFMPLGNDLLVVALSAAHRQRMWYYVLMSTVGSTIGADLTRWASARGRDKVDESNKSRRMAYIERKVKEHGGLALAVAALMPPPFPFTPFVAVAGALRYPRRRMLVVLTVSRAVRFGFEGVLALIYGRAIIRMARAPWVENSILALVVVSVAGSVWSIVNLVRKSRGR